MAIQLHVAPGVPLGPCGPAELRQFMAHPVMRDYLLIVVDADRAYACLKLWPLVFLWTCVKVVNNMERHHCGEKSASRPPLRTTTVLQSSSLIGWKDRSLTPRPASLSSSTIFKGYPIVDAYHGPTNRPIEEWGQDPSIKHGQNPFHRFHVLLPNASLPRPLA